MIEAYKIYLIGIVQGVGFRPYVYRVALKSGVKVYVKNLGGAEVEIHIEGSRSEIENFFKYFYRNKPESIVIEELLEIFSAI